MPLSRETSKKKKGYLSVAPLLQELIQSTLNRPRAPTIFLFHEFLEALHDGRRQRDVESLEAFFLDVSTASASIDTHCSHPLYKDSDLKQICQWNPQPIGTQGFTPIHNFERTL